MKEKIEKLIKNLKSRKRISGLDVYKVGDTCDWFYYYHITGIYLGRFFSFTLKKGKSTCNDEFTHSSVSDEKEFFNKLVNKMLSWKMNSLIS